MKHLTLFALALVLAFPATVPAQSENSKPGMASRLKQFLERTPAADANKDGTLTREQVKAFNETRKVSANNRSQADRRAALNPTHANLKYGDDHERQRFDLYLAPRKDGDPANPLAIYIHGGGFRGGTKMGVAKGAIDAYHAAGKAEDWNSERVKNLMIDASAITHLDKTDTASVSAEYRAGDLPVAADTNPSIWVHHVKLGLKLQEAMQALDLECIVRSPDHKENDPYGSMESFFIKKLKE